MRQDDFTPTPRQKLNEQANQLTSLDNPQSAEEEEIQAICDDLSTTIEPSVEELYANSSFTKREATAWILRKTPGSNHARLTQEAVAIYMNLMLDTNSPITTDDVVAHLDEANQKYEQAEQTVGQLTFPQREEVLDNPKVGWLSADTVRDAKQFLSDEEITNLDEAVQHLLELSNEVRDVRDVVKGYLACRGASSVAQIAVQSDQIPLGTLRIVSHYGQPEEQLPDIVSETDAVTVGNEPNQYELEFYEDNTGPYPNRRLTLHANSSIHGMDSYALEQGLQDLEQAVQENPISLTQLVQRAKNHVGAVAVGVKLKQNSSNIQIVPDSLEPKDAKPTDRFRHITKVSVRNETFHTNVRDQATIGELGDYTIVWADDNVEGCAPVSLETGIQTLLDDYTGNQ